MNGKKVKKMVGEVEGEGKSKQVFGIFGEGSAGGCGERFWHRGCNNSV